MFLLRASTVLLGFSMPISVALDNFLLAAILLGMVFNLPHVWKIAKQNPVARAAWMLFLALFAAMFYGVASLHDAVNCKVCGFSFHTDVHAAVTQRYMEAQSAICFSRRDGTDFAVVVSGWIQTAASTTLDDGNDSSR